MRKFLNLRTLIIAAVAILVWTQKDKLMGFVQSKLGGAKPATDDGNSGDQTAENMDEPRDEDEDLIA